MLDRIIAYLDDLHSGRLDLYVQALLERFQEEDHEKVIEWASRTSIDGKTLLQVCLDGEFQVILASFNAAFPSP
jgi:hypothetical protein